MTYPYCAECDRAEADDDSDTCRSCRAEYQWYERVAEIGCDGNCASCVNRVCDVPVTDTTPSEPVVWEEGELPF